MTEFYEGQQVRIKQTAFGDSTDAADEAFRGQVCELLADLGTENGTETMWYATVPGMGMEAYLLDSELEPLETQP